MYIDNVSLRNFNIGPDDWETAAANGSKWRGRIANGAINYEELCIDNAEKTSRCTGSSQLSVTLLALTSVLNVDDHSVLP